MNSTISNDHTKAIIENPRKKTTRIILVKYLSKTLKMINRVRIIQIRENIKI